jgi:hypothetical protein
MLQAPGIVPSSAQACRAASGLAAMVLCVLVLPGCGGNGQLVIGPGQLTVTSLSLTPAAGFPGPPNEILMIRDGQRLRALARLVPRRLPPRPAGTREGLTVCFPMDLTIGLSNGDKIAYPSCQRPRSLLRLVREMCPFLHKPGFCFRYRNELA